jgi:hypothetical protein
MQHPIPALYAILALCLCAASPVSAQAAMPDAAQDAQAQAVAELRAGPAPKSHATASAEIRAAKSQGGIPAEAEVREYIKLFGYREMLELGLERQLEMILEVVRQTRPNLPPGVLDLIRQELKSELKAESEQSVAEMVAVFQSVLTPEDVAYLVRVGRDPRMQRVVSLQPRIAADLEGVGERLAEAVTAKAGPRIEERLRRLQGGREL